MTKRQLSQTPAAIEARERRLMKSIEKQEREWYAEIRALRFAHSGISQMTREQIEAALERLISASALLQANCEGCAVNHYGEDFSIHGMSGWLADTKADIDRARQALAALRSAKDEVSEAAIEAAALAILHATCDHYGDPRPSDPDLSLTKLLAKAALIAARKAREK